MKRDVCLMNVNWKNNGILWCVIHIFISSSESMSNSHMRLCNNNKNIRLKMPTIITWRGKLYYMHIYIIVAVGAYCVCVAIGNVHMRD